MGSILCFGDSNTWGLDPRSPLGEQYDKPWCSILAQISGRQVINAGENGRTVPDSAASREILYRLIRRSMPVSLLILMLGTNDLLSGLCPDADSLAEKTGRLLADLRIHFPDLNILLLPPPHCAVSDVPEKLVPLLRHIAVCRNLLFCEHLQQIPLAFDGVHFSEAGHQTFAHILAALPVSRARCCPVQHVTRF